MRETNRLGLAKRRQIDDEAAAMAAQQAQEMLIIDAAARASEEERRLLQDFAEKREGTRPSSSRDARALRRFGKAAAPGNGRALP